MPESGEFQQTASEKTKEGIIISRSACGEQGFDREDGAQLGGVSLSKEQRFASIMDSP